LSLAIQLLITAADTLRVSAKDIAAIAESYAKILALAAAGFWTYVLFVRQRQRYPRATIRETGVLRRLDKDRNLLTVGVQLKNIGQRLIEVDYITVVVQQLAPLSQSAITRALGTHNPRNAADRREILWYRIGLRLTRFENPHLEIEPGESEHLEFDFTVAPSVRTIKVQTHVENVAKRRTIRNWLLAKFPQSARISIMQRSARYLGWQCTSYYNLPEDPRGFTRLSNALTTKEVVDD
jgi:hypothetical protein